MKKVTLITLIIAASAFAAFKNTDKKPQMTTSPETKIAIPKDGQTSFAVDAGKSTFTWTGKKVTGDWEPATAERLTASILNIL